MRTLFSGSAGFGHIVPQIPLARALRGRGCGVAFVSAASVSSLLAPEKFELLEAGPEIWELVAEVERNTGVSVAEQGVTFEVEAEFFAGARIDLGYLDALAAARHWKPDLIVAEAFDFIGPMVGAALGVPVATLTFGPSNLPASVEAMQLRARARHRRFGLDVGPARWTLDTCPPALQQEEWQTPEAGWVGLRPEAYSSGEPALAAVPREERVRPRILVSFGTSFVVPEIISPIVRGLLKQDVDVRVTLGPAKTAEEFHIDSDRVEFVGFNPLARLLTDVDLVLTVGGAGTVLGALANGIPLVMTPLGADQPLFAGRAAATGAGIAFELGEFEPDAVAEATKTVLAEPAYRDAAARVAAEIAAMTSPADVAEMLLAAHARRH